MNEIKSHHLWKNRKTVSKTSVPEGGKITIFLTEHAMSRIERRFNIDDREQIERVLEEAATDGFVSSDGGDLLVEHGCLLATCSHDGNGTLTVMTVLNLTDGISKEMKERTRNARPSSWEEVEVKISGDEPEELNLPPSPGSSVFSKKSHMESSYPSKKTRGSGLNNE